jgi:RHS repeat-associated protein
LNKATKLTYDAAGNQLTVTDALTHVTTSVYDVDNRLWKTIFADGTTRITTYDREGQRIAETDQAGKITQFAYDGDGRLVSVTDALNQVTSHGYDEVGNRVSVTDAAGKVTRFAYDSAGRETKRTLPDATYEAKTYDAGGELWTHTDFQGRTTTYGYDVAGRLTSKTYPDSSTVSFGYTPNGRRTSAVDARGTTTYAYDNRDRLTAMQSPDGKRIEYGYDSASNRTSLTAKVGSTARATGYTYDVLDRISNVTDPDSRVFGLEYDDVGSLSKLVRPNGVDTKFDHDSLNRLTNIRTYTRSPDTTIASYGYTLGATGIRTRIDEADGTSRGYQYDDLYRLTKETVNGAQSYENSFTYDAVSNRKTQTRTGAVVDAGVVDAADGVDACGSGSSTVNYSYDNRDRLTGENGTIYSWNVNGNLVGKTGEATYEWDFEDRLVKVTKADGTVVENVYDVDGVLVRTAVNGVGTDLLVDTSGGLSHVVAEVDSSGAVSVLYVRAGGTLLEEVRGGVAKMYEADGLGSTRSLLDGSGATTDTYSYDAFGNTVSSTGTDGNPYRFAGERLIENTGMYQNRARWLDTRTGRFVSVDPAVDATSSPYGYGSQDPVNRVDATGEFDTLTGVMVGLGAASILAGCATPSFTSNVNTAKTTPTQTLFLYNNLISFTSQIGRDINSVINPPVGTLTNPLYQDDLIRRVTRIVGKDKMIHPIPVLVSSGLDIMRALERPDYSNVVYFGHVVGDLLQPMLPGGDFLSADDFGLSVHPVSSISLIGCYSLGFADSLRTAMRAHQKRGTEYWGTDTLVYQDVAGTFKDGVKTTSIYQDVKGMENVGLQKVLTGLLRLE